MFCLCPCSIYGSSYVLFNTFWSFMSCSVYVTLDVPFIFCKHSNYVSLDTFRLCSIYGSIYICSVYVLSTDLSMFRLRSPSAYSCQFCQFWQFWQCQDLGSAYYWNPSLILSHLSIICIHKSSVMNILSTFSMIIIILNKSSSVLEKSPEKKFTLLLLPPLLLSPFASLRTLCYCSCTT